MHDFVFNIMETNYFEHYIENYPIIRLDINIQDRKTKILKCSINHKNDDVMKMFAYTLFVIYLGNCAALLDI